MNLKQLHLKVEEIRKETINLFNIVGIKEGKVFKNFKGYKSVEILEILNNLNIKVSIKDKNNKVFTKEVRSIFFK